MKITHHEVECTCKKKNRVLVELTEDEAAHLADFFTEIKRTSLNPPNWVWVSVGRFAEQIIELAGQW